MMGSMAAMITAACVGATLISSSVTRINEGERFKKYAHNPLIARSKKADEVISLVKCLANE